MSFARLLTSRARVWRRTDAVNAYGATEAELTFVGEYPCSVRRPAAPLADPGPGLTPTGARQFYFLTAADVRLRDVLVLSGPDAGRWEVNEPPTRVPRGHHLEVMALAWAGRLPDDGLVTEPPAPPDILDVDFLP